MAETEEVKSKRDIALERLRAKYPEEQFEDDDQVFGRIVDDFDQYDKDLAGYKEREEKFSNLFTSDPRSSRLMMAWKDGKDPASVLISLYGDDIKDALDDPAKQEAIAAANKEYMERVVKERQYEEEYKSNLQESLSRIESKQQELGLSDSQVDQALELLVSIAKDAVTGKFTDASLDMSIKALNYENDVEQAGAEGEVRGRNTKVREELRKPAAGDKMPQLDGKNGWSRKRDIPDLGAIDRYDEGNMNIFERGGEKRIPYKR